jgi:NADH:ubiquinone oxidoreductase subunit 5 (subunit L)/multisubunit Na+/H+ antiporter MnhA subunit
MPRRAWRPAARDAVGRHVPLVLLAIPSVIIGAMTIGPMLFGDFFKGAIVVAEKHDVLGEMARNSMAHSRWRCTA